MDNTEVKITFQNKVTGFSGKTGLMAYEEKLKSVKNLIESMPKNLNFGGDVDKKLETTNKLLINLNKNMSSLKRSTTSTLGNMSKNVEGINKKIKNFNKDNSKTKDIIETAFSVQALKQFGMELERLVINSTKFIRKSAEYTENLNLLSVAFKEQGVEIEKTTNEALKFVNTLSQMYGLDESKVIRMTGLFKQMANSLGITSEAGTKLSQTLTQLSVDAASLFNAKEIEDAARVFQSALASQTKPIRGFTGADITEQTLQVTLETYGIDEAISSLSYAEKRLVIVASLVDQLDEAIGDFGRTIESPANQMKIFTEQAQRLARAIGNVLMPVFAKILPYINAFMMVLVEVTNYIANFVAELFGYNFDNFNPFSGMDDSVTALEEDMNGAAESAKKLKSGLRGFDKLNVISSSSKKDDGSGSGSGVGGAYYDLLNQAVDKYNSKLEKTKMLATKIRDDILQWLGFTVKTDEATGKLKIAFEEITGGTVLGALAVGGTIYGGIVTISRVLSKIGILSKPLPTLFDLLKKAIMAIPSIISGIGTALSSLGTAVSGIVTAIATATGLSVGWVVAIGVAIAALVASIIIYWDEIKLFTTQLFEKIGKFFTDLYKKFMEKIVNPILEFVKEVADFIYKYAIKPIIDFFSPIVTAIVDIFKLIIKNVTEIVVGVGKAIWSILEKIGEIFLKIVEIFVALGKAFYEYIIKPVVDFIVDIALEIGEFFGMLFEKIGKIFKAIYDTVIKPIIDLFVNVGAWVYNKIVKPIWDKIVWLKDKAVEIFKTIGTTVVNFVSGAFKGVINGVLSTIESTINGFIKMLNAAIKLINEIPGVEISKVKLLNIPRLKVGMDFVPSDYFPAYLDYGERVLTREENQDYNRGIIRGEKVADSSPINATFVIQVGSKEIARTVLNDLQNMAKSNGKPITIS